MYEKFVMMNTRDEEQDHSRAFKFSDYDVKVNQAYTKSGGSSFLKILIVFSSLLCLSWLVSLLS